MKALLKTLWKQTLEPVYDALFRRYFDATISRLNTVLEMRTELDKMNARLDQLDAHVRTVIAARWDEGALARRLAMLEDRLAENGAGGRSGIETEKTEPE